LLDPDQVIQVAGIYVQPQRPWANGYHPPGRSRQSH
jgi:hypothetical protein